MSSFYLRQGKSIVETGELRERITICKREEIIDRKSGVQKTVYTPLVETRAKIIGENGKEFLGADRELSRIRKRVFIRKRRNLDVSEDLFIKYKDHVYSIYESFPIDVMFLEIRIERVEK